MIFGLFDGGGVDEHNSVASIQIYEIYFAIHVQDNSSVRRCHLMVYVILARFMRSHSTHNTDKEMIMVQIAMVITSNESTLTLNCENPRHQLHIIDSQSCSGRFSICHSLPYQ